MKIFLHFIVLKYMGSHRLIFRSPTIIHSSVHYISLISLFLHQTLCPYIAFIHTHSFRAVCMLIFAIQFTTLRLRQCGVFKIREQEKHGTMDFQYTGVQNSSMRAQIIADSKTCCGKLVIFNFCFTITLKIISMPKVRFNLSLLDRVSS